MNEALNHVSQQSVIAMKQRLSVELAQAAHMTNIVIKAISCFTLTARMNSTALLDDLRRHELPQPL